MKFLAIALLAIVAATAVSADSAVVKLTSANFDNVIANEKVLMVEFFAPWCGHCKALAPKYEAAAGILAADNIKLAAVDCTVEQEQCTHFGVRGYPTVKIFRQGEQPTDYNGARETNDIVSAMRKAALPTVTLLQAGEVADFSTKARVVIVGEFAESDTENIKKFDYTAKTLRDNYVFGRVVGASAAKVTLYKSFDEGVNVYDGDFSGESLAAFIAKNSMPIMDDISQANYQSYASSGLPLGFFFIADDAQRKELGPSVEEVAREFKGKINFVYIDANKFAGFAESLNLKTSWPAFVVQNIQNNVKFPLAQDTPLTAERIRVLAQNIVDGTATPSYKSEEIPATQDGPVTVVVNKNFNEIVMGGKDVLIEFYAPWCGHCKKLAPVYDAVGRAFKANPNVVIAKMDSTANDLPLNAPFTVQGFPTIYLVRADGTTIAYDGEREFDDITSFVIKNAVHGSDVPIDESARHDEL